MASITDIVYTIDGSDVIATHPNSTHHLTWHRDTGHVHRDDEPTPIARGLDEHLFHVDACDYFHVDRSREHGTPLAHGPRGPHRLPSYQGAGWGMNCACGHYRTGWRARRRDAEKAMAEHLAATAPIVIPQQRSATP